jgi:hypothetical protein
MTLDQIRASRLNIRQEFREKLVHTSPRSSRIKVTGYVKGARAGHLSQFQTLCDPAPARRTGSAFYNQYPRQRFAVVALRFE